MRADPDNLLQAIGRCRDAPGGPWGVHMRVQFSKWHAWAGNASKAIVEAVSETPEDVLEDLWRKITSLNLQ